MHDAHAASPQTKSEHVCAMELEHCLEVGLEVFLDPTPGQHNSNRYPARVRGWERGRYILLGMHAEAGMPGVRQGKLCVIRFMHEGEVWGFSAGFSEAIPGGGFPLIQLYWPAEVARVQVRKHERVTIQTPCMVDLGDGDPEQATIGDLSGGGCSLVMNREIAVGAMLRLSFRMPDGGKVSARPVIVRNRKAIPGQGMKYGCQFQVAEDKDHGIELFVARKIAIERGEATPHPQILVLSRNETDVEVAQQALHGCPYEIVEATGILDLGYRLRTCVAVAILISFEQKELSAIEILPLIRQSPGMEKIPLFMYGGSSLHDQAITMGATLCLPHLAAAGEILAHLPAPAQRAARGDSESRSEAAPASSGSATDAAAAPESPRPAPTQTTASGTDEAEIQFEE